MNQKLLCRVLLDRECRKLKLRGLVVHGGGCGLRLSLVLSLLSRTKVLGASSCMTTNDGSSKEIVSNVRARAMSTGISGPVKFSRLCQVIESRDGMDRIESYLVILTTYLQCISPVSIILCRATIHMKGRGCENTSLGFETTENADKFVESVSATASHNNFPIISLCSIPSTYGHIYCGSVLCFVKRSNIMHDLFAMDLSSGFSS